MPGLAVVDAELPVRCPAPATGCVCASFLRVVARDRVVDELDEHPSQRRARSVQGRHRAGDLDGQLRWKLERARERRQERAHVDIDRLRGLHLDLRVAHEARHHLRQDREPAAHVLQVLGDDGLARAQIFFEPEDEMVERAQRHLQVAGRDRRQARRFRVTMLERLDASREPRFELANPRLVVDRDQWERLGSRSSSTSAWPSKSR